MDRLFSSAPLPEQGPIPRAFVVDRCESQERAIEAVFPYTKVIFCRKHLAVNIRPHMAVGSPMGCETVLASPNYLTTWENLYQMPNTN
jgi:hypothetical protein